MGERWKGFLVPRRMEVVLLEGAMEIGGWGVFEPHGNVT